MENLENFGKIEIELTPKLHYACTKGDLSEDFSFLFLLVRGWLLSLLLTKSHVVD